MQKEDSSLKYKGDSFFSLKKNQKISLKVFGTPLSRNAPAEKHIRKFPFGG